MVPMGTVIGQRKFGTCRSCGRSIGKLDASLTGCICGLCRTERDRVIIAVLRGVLAAKESWHGSPNRADG